MTIELPDIEIEGGDLAFLLGVLFNQRIRSELAWRAPARLCERLGTCDPQDLAAADPVKLAGVIRQGPALHPWANTMACNIVGTCELLVQNYQGRARSVWSDRPAGPVLLARFSAFPGIGRHKARVAIALLVLKYGQPIGDSAALTAQALASCPRLTDAVLLSPSETERTRYAPARSSLRRRGSMLQSI
jgi:uncharacterized HhH-GPD family protein